MKEFVINNRAKIVAWLIASILIYLNASMLWEVTSAYLKNNPHFIITGFIFLGLFCFAALIVYVIIYPIFFKPKQTASIRLHQEPVVLGNTPIPQYNRIAVALDFSDRDSLVIASAIGQSNAKTSFILIHIVETALAQWNGKDAYDFETAKDQEHLDHLVKQMIELGHDAKGVLGYQEVPKEIARIIREESSDLLVIGAHGHQGLSDFVYGATINAVRHELNIPVHIVNLG
jgi:manganese transport protein